MYWHVLSYLLFSLLERNCLASTTIYSEDFSSATLSSLMTDGWSFSETSNSNDLGVYDNSYLYLGDTSSSEYAELSIDTDGYNNVVISLDMAQIYLENGEDCRFKVKTNSGGSFTEIARIGGDHSGSTWYSRSTSSTTLNPSLDDNSNVVLRLESEQFSHSEWCAFTDISIVGDVITSAPSYSPTYVPTVEPTYVPTESPTYSPTESPTYSPTVEPTYVPTESPTYSPTVEPTYVPTHAPTHVPTESPTYSPTVEPTHVPTESPTHSPTVEPTHVPTESPTHSPTVEPTHVPTEAPTYVPTESPTHSPTDEPTYVPTESPTYSPTVDPTYVPTESPTFNPTVDPTYVPTESPTFSPTDEPTYVPTDAPTYVPTDEPTHVPTESPTYNPTVDPTYVPTESPTYVPTDEPTYVPTESPTYNPTVEPTYVPTEAPTHVPTESPTYVPTDEPTHVPTESPTFNPTDEPTYVPTESPTFNPTVDPTYVPTESPTFSPTDEPTYVPTESPTYSPTDEPTYVPTESPTYSPTDEPTYVPTESPTYNPTDEPTYVPTESPTYSPTDEPTYVPTESPTYSPTDEPTYVPTESPTYNPTDEPTYVPTESPTYSPTDEPTYVPTESPTYSPTDEPTYVPTESPTYNPTVEPTFSPTDEPTYVPTESPTYSPTDEPTYVPTESPTFSPTVEPTYVPTESPTYSPTVEPTYVPTESPTYSPTDEPTYVPTESPTYNPTVEPTFNPTVEPTYVPTESPTYSPTDEPTYVPTESPTFSPTDEPTYVPTESHTYNPTDEPTYVPTESPTVEPTYAPTLMPTAIPTYFPSTVVSNLPSMLPSYLGYMNFENSPLNLEKIDTTKKFYLTITVESEQNCIPQWTSDKINSTELDASMLMDQFTVPKNIETTFHFILDKNTLEQGETYTFTVSCKALTESIQIITNIPPKHGQLVVTPVEGIELEDPFRLIAYDYMDDDIPLSFRFGYISNTNQDNLLQKKSASNTTNTILPAGSNSKHFEINCTVSVYDIFDANTHSKSTVKVTESKVDDEFFQQTFNNSVDELIFTLLAGEKLNRVNCTGVSNCSYFNRHDCGDLDFSCGSCFDGYIPVINTSMCMNSSLIDTNTYIGKTCGDACNRHGTCIYESIFKKEVLHSCDLNDNNCKATCQCNHGFSGEVCSINEEIMNSKQKARENVLSSLKNNVLGFSNTSSNITDSSTVNDMIISLATIADSPYELNTNSYVLISETANILLSTENGVHEENSVGILNALDSVLESSGDIENNTMITENLFLFTDLMVKNQVSGEIAKQYSTNSFTVKTEIHNNHSTGLALSTVEVMSKFYSDTSSLTNTKMLKISSSEQKEVEIEVQLNIHTSVQFFSEEMNVTTVCDTNSSRFHRSYTHICPVTNHVINHNCSGKIGNITSMCPKVLPQCTIENDNTCEVISTMNGYLKCKCVMKTSTNTKSRRLSNTVEESNVLVLVGTAVYVYTDVQQTFTAASSFNSLESVQDTLLVVSTFVILWAVGFLLLFTCGIRNKVRAKTDQVIYSTVEQQKKLARVARSPISSKNHFVQYIDSLFPSVYDSTSIIHRCINECFQHHRYLQLFSSSIGEEGGRKRVLGIVHLLTLQSLLLFLLAVFFDIYTSGNDGSKCNGFTVEEECISLTSSIDTSQHLCKWYSTDTNDNGYCVEEPENISFLALIYIFVLVSFVTSIMMFPIDKIIDVLSAKVSDVKKNQVANEKTVEHKRRMAHVSRISTVSTSIKRQIKNNVGSTYRDIPESTLITQQLAKESSIVISRKIESTLNRREWDNSTRALENREMGNPRSNIVHSEENSRSLMQKQFSILKPSFKVNDIFLVDEFNQLKQDLRLQCTNLQPVELEIFEKQWGLDPCGNFVRKNKRYFDCSRSQLNTEDMILHELEFVNNQVQNMRKKLQTAPDSIIGLEIMHSFILDILGRNSNVALIYQSKSFEDFKEMKIVSKWQKYLCIGSLIGLNLFFFGYSILKGHAKGYQWQRTYVIAAITQLIVEVVLFESMECIWINFCVPSFAKEEINRARNLLMTTISTMFTVDNGGVDVNEQYRYMDAPKYLFISTKLAKHFPETFESKIVRFYHTHLPGELSKKWLIGMNQFNYERTIGKLGLVGSLLFSLQYIAASPFLLQRLILRFTQPLVISGIFIAWNTFIGFNEFTIPVTSGIILLSLLFAFNKYLRDESVLKRTTKSVIPIPNLKFVPFIETKNTETPSLQERYSYDSPESEIRPVERCNIVSDSSDLESDCFDSDSSFESDSCFESGSDSS